MKTQTREELEMVDKVGKLQRMTAMALVGAVLAGCQALDDLDRQNYQRGCDNLGIERGTPTYDKCMLQQQRLDVEQTEGSLNRSVKRDLARDL